jgi:hypothetical protein
VSTTAVFFCRPFTCDTLALDVAPEHEETLRDRLSRGAFCPRTLWNTRPNVFRLATKEENAALQADGYHFQVYEWCIVWRKETTIGH